MGLEVSRLRRRESGGHESNLRRKSNRSPPSFSSSPRRNRVNLPTFDDFYSLPQGEESIRSSIYKIFGIFAFRFQTRCWIFHVSCKFVGEWLRAGRNCAVILSRSPLMKFESNRVDRRRPIEKVTNRLDDDTKMHRVIIDLYFPRNRENVDLLARASISSGSIDLNRFSGGGAFFAAPPSLFYCNLSYCGKLISSSCPPPPAHPFPSKRNRPSFDRRQLRDP